MINKKITRKQFLLSALSLAGLFVVNKLSSPVKDIMPTKKEEGGPSYGNYSYGGGKKNA